MKKYISIDIGGTAIKYGIVSEDAEVLLKKEMKTEAQKGGPAILDKVIGIVEALNHGCHNLYERAEYLDVTEEYLKEALDAYRDKYGVRTDIDNYTVCFIPYLTVFKKV